MKKRYFILALMLFLLLVFLLASGQIYAETLRVLAIGNSFSVCVTKYLPQVTASVPGCRIILTSAHIGGCSLEKHWNNVSLTESGTPRLYAFTVADSKTPEQRKKFRGTLNNALKNERFDIITIQQNSANSIGYTTFQPYAANLIAYIKKHQPQAEIVIQQTWSYRCDSPRLKRWGIDTTTMYARLAESYARMAKEYGFRLIPSGYAVQVFRAKTPVKYLPPTGEQLKTYQKPDVPPFTGEVVGKYIWKKRKGGDKTELLLDAIHLNSHGNYLQAAVWFSFLFGKPATEIKFFPEKIDRAQAEFLLSCAADAMNGFVQPGVR